MAIVKTEAYFHSSTGQQDIRTLIWREESLSPVGVFQMAHGMAEHIDRYDGFARFLASNGFVVCGNDHLGHGKSVRSAADYGFFADQNGDKRLVDDMHILTRIMKKKYPGIPYFLFGHSMGSLCARVYAAHFGDELNGVIFCGTVELPAAAEALRPVVDAACERFGPRADADKLGGYRDLFALAAECAQREWASRLPEALPVMIIAGAKDPVGFNGRGPLAVADNLVLAGHDPTVILYPGDRHEILFEADHELVYKDVLAWLHSIYLQQA